MHALSQRQLLLLPASAASALAVGAMVAVSPMLALATVGGAVLLVLPFIAPVTHLALLLVATAIVPYGLMNTYGIGGGIGSAGLLLSDVLLIGGLARAGLVLVRTRIRHSEALLLLLVAAFLGLVTLQFAHGVARGAELSTAGNEMRTLLGFSALLVALPILQDARQRRRLLGGLLAVGILLGVVGLAQWFFGTAFSEQGDFGVRDGVAHTSGGRGQLQGGMFGYPVAVVLAFAALVAPTRHATHVRVLVLAALVLNAAGVLLTFERTLWAVTVLGCAFVAVRAQRVQRFTLVLRGLAALVVGLAVLATLSPATFTTARERLLSIGQYGQDVSVEYRLRESQFVAAEIRERPIAGSGLGATVYWGRPKYQVPAEEKSYSHNGFLWLAWKVGIPTALLAFAFVAAVIVRRPRPRGSPTFDTVVVGAQGALAALLVANVMFPTVSAPSSTVTVGLLLALALLPRRPGAAA